MPKKIHYFRHLFDFILLLAIIGVGLLGLILFKFDKAAQLAVIILISTIYIFWGGFHHHSDGNLTGKIILEYTLMSILIGILLSTLVLRV